jgi:transcriptional regulator GlxA family with amidase domain
MQDLGIKLADVSEELDCFSISHTPAPRLQAALWSVLWRLSDGPSGSLGSDVRHPAVNVAVRRISQHLADEISVVDLAKDACVSYGYLGKLFKAEFGTSVVGFIRERRLKRAVHLLQKSTMSVKSVACSVGIPDLQLFNKTVRRATGLSPRAVRERFQG